MEKHSPAHSRLLTAAARRILSPLGLTQKGRSRTWLGDYGWWLVVVEFQPSSWSGGSYLNVGCSWLWHVKNQLSFDLGYRVNDFHSFEDEPQFQVVAAQLAETAAQEAQRYRDKFPDVAAVARYYESLPASGFWPTFHAGVACALAGRSVQAQRFFDVVLQARDERNWVTASQAEAQQLRALADDTEQIRYVVGETIRQTRVQQRLPALPKLEW